MYIYIYTFIKKMHYDSNKSMFFLSLYTQNIGAMMRPTYLDKIIFRFSFIQHALEWF